MTDNYTDKHLHNKSVKSQQTHRCASCDYNTCSLKDFNKHILTIKHKKLTNTYVIQ